MSDVTTDTMMHSVAAGIAVDIAEEGFDRVSAILSGPGFPVAPIVPLALRLPVPLLPERR